MGVLSKCRSWDSGPTIAVGPIDIKWGDLSQIKAELCVLAAAAANGQYDYYHLISGQDLPLHNQNYIHEFLSKNDKVNYIGFAQGSSNERSLNERILYYVPFTGFYRVKNPLVRYVVSIVRGLIVRLQRKCGYKKKMPYLNYKKGCNWATMTDDFVRMLIASEKSILSTYKGTPCADEIYKQTFIWNSPLRSTLINTTEYDACLREIDWNRGAPYTYTKDDIAMLLSSKCLFGRKFNSKIDKCVIDAVVDSVKATNK